MPSDRDYTKPGDRAFAWWWAQKRRKQRAEAAQAESES